MQFEINDTIQRFNRAESILGDFSNYLANMGNPTITHVFCDNKKEYQWYAKDIQNIDFASILISEFLHHINAALDNLAWTLSIAGSYPNEPTNPRKIYYPVFSCKNRFQEHSHNILSRNIANDAISLIEESQPYHTQNPEQHPLSLLKRLSNIDKHRSLHVLSAAKIGFGITLRTEQGDMPVTKCPIIFEKGPLKEGMIFATLPWPFEFELSADLAFVIDYVIDDGISSNLKPAQIALVKILKFVDEELLEKRFKPYFGVS